MHTQQVNRLSGIVVILLSLTALLMVLIGIAQPPQPPPQDEGTLAHIFQLSIVALVPVTFLYLATADWRQPWRSARLPALAAATTILAFGLLAYLENYR